MICIVVPPPYHHMYRCEPRITICIDVPPPQYHIMIYIDAPPPHHDAYHSNVSGYVPVYVCVNILI